MLLTVFSQWFGYIYDTVFNIFHPDFQDSVFWYFFESGFYVKLGLIFILIPLGFMSVFYYLCYYPYGRWWHWLILLVIAILVVFGTTYGYSRSFILGSNAQEMTLCYNVEECSEYIQALPMKYAWVNTILGSLIGFIGSLLLKQGSKVQTHLPF